MTDPPPGQAQQEWADELTRQLLVAQKAAGEAERALVAAVVLCRKAGWSWTDVGETLGVTRQAAWERFARGRGIE